MHITPQQFNLLFYRRIQINQIFTRYAKKQLKHEQNIFRNSISVTSLVDACDSAAACGYLYFKHVLL